MGRPKGSKNRDHKEKTTSARVREVDYDVLRTCAEALRISVVDLFGRLADSMRLQNPHLFRPKGSMVLPDLSVEALHSEGDRIKPRRPPVPKPDSDCFRLIPQGGDAPSAEGDGQGDG